MKKVALLSVALAVVAVFFWFSYEKSPAQVDGVILIDGSELDPSPTGSGPSGQAPSAKSGTEPPAAKVPGVTPLEGTLSVTPDPQEGSLILVNGQYPLPEDYYPLSVMTIYGNLPDRPFSLARVDIALQTEALDALVRLCNEANAQGMQNYLLLSGFRDYAKQASLFDAAEPQGDYLDTQPPGHSEHQTGLAVDMSKQSVGMHEFLDTPEGRWILNYCAQYGFVQRFADGKQELTGIIEESWHFRYVGCPHAQIMTALNLCLEEYIDMLREKKCVRTIVNNETFEIRATDEKTFLVRENAVVSGDNRGGFIITTPLS